MKLRTHIIACLLISLCAISALAKDKIKLDTKQTAEYRTLLLVATNSSPASSPRTTSRAV